ncbi:MAG: nucleotide modification associated domain-containing protein [Candidatus Micrarchaeia archaeon]
MGTANFESWAGNFKAAVDKVIGACSAVNGDFADALVHMNEFFWNKFDTPKSIENFSDDGFFEELAVTALRAASALSGKPVADVGKECYELGVRKNKDYGSDNILRFGTMGIIVRIGDKINRLNNIQKSGTASVTDEKMIDTIMDVFNYAVYGIMLSNNVWF